jgi:hypothetical protein
VADGGGDVGEPGGPGFQLVGGEVEPQGGQIRQGRLADNLGEADRESRAGETRRPRQRLDRPAPRRVLVQVGERPADQRIVQAAQPAQVPRVGGAPADPDGRRP